MIKYRNRRKYKYTLADSFPYETGIEVEFPSNTRYLEIDSAGHLLIKAGYAWDGATGFPDIKTIMKGSLVHDALYQLLREGVLKPADRNRADRILEEICIESGMSRWLADKVYRAVNLLGAKAASSEPLTAP